VIDDPLFAHAGEESKNGNEAADPELVQRLIFCSGKIYIDMIANEKRQARPQIAIARVEQLYPFPSEEVKGVLSHYPSLSEVVWVQEEAQNMGAWEFARPILEELLGGKLPLRYVGRPRRASPAEGSTAWHQSNQTTIVEHALMPLGVTVHATVPVGRAKNKRTKA